MQADLVKGFRAKDTRTLLELITRHQTDYTAEALDCLKGILRERLPGTNFDDQSHLEALLRKQDEEQEAANRDLIARQESMCNVCGHPHVHARIPIYVGRKGKREWQKSLPSMLGSLALNAVMIPLLGAGGLELEQYRQYNLIKVDFLLCSNCAKTHGTQGTCLARENNVLIGKLYEAGWELFDEEEYREKFIQAD